MPFTIPNAADDPNAGGPFTQPDKVDFDIITSADLSNGVISGCAVTGSGTTNVAVAAGVVQINGSLVAVAAGNVAITTGHATLTRLDLVVVDNTGAKSTVIGTPLAQPVFGAIPANSVVLAAVFQPATGTNIASTQVVDKRIVVMDIDPIAAVYEAATYR